MDGSGLHSNTIRLHCPENTTQLSRNHQATAALQLPLVMKEHKFKSIVTYFIISYFIIFNKNEMALDS